MTTELRAIGSGTPNPLPPPTDSSQPDEPGALASALPLRDRRGSARFPASLRATGATVPLAWSDLHDRLGSELRRSGFRITYDVGRAPGHRRGSPPPWDRGSITAERSLRREPARSHRRLASGLASLALSFALFGLVLVRDPHPGVGGWVFLGLGCGLLLLAFRWIPSFRTFSSDVVFVEYDARRVRAEPRSPDSPRIYDVRVGCARVLSGNWYSEDSRGRRVRAILPTSGELPRVPGRLIARLTHEPPESVGGKGP